MGRGNRGPIYVGETALWVLANFQLVPYSSAAAEQNCPVGTVIFYCSRSTEKPEIMLISFFVYFGGVNHKQRQLNDHFTIDRILNVQIYKSRAGYNNK